MPDKSTDQNIFFLRINQKRIINLLFSCSILWVLLRNASQSASSSAQQPNFVQHSGKIGVFSGGKLIQNVFTLIPKLRPAVIIARQTELVVIVINWRLLQNRTNSSQDEIQTRWICTLTIVGNFFFWPKTVECHAKFNPAIEPKLLFCLYFLIKVWEIYKKTLLKVTSLEEV